MIPDPLLHVALWGLESTVGSDLMKLADKRIVLTGGTSGIGWELARRLCRDNQLVVLSRKSARLDRLRSELPGVEVLEVDLADSGQVVSCANLLAERYEQIDLLINNAAVQFTPTFQDADFDFDSIAREIAVNFTSPCQLIAKLMPSLEKAPRAMIVNVNSGLGLVPKTSSAVYCGTKGGLNIFSQALANQLEGSSVTVKQVFLPLVDTAMTSGRGTGKLSAGGAAERIIKGIEGRQDQIDIGKVSLLRLINRLSPLLAANIMKKA